MRLEGTDNPSNYNLISGTEGNETLVGTEHQDMISAAKIFARDLLRFFAGT